MEEFVDRRGRTFVKVVPWGAGIGTGVVSGIVANLAISDLNGTALTINPLVFLAAAVPVGTAVFFFQRVMLGRIRRTVRGLRVQRVAIVDHNLLVEIDSGQTVTWPLKGVGVSTESPAGGWFIVWQFAGSSATFWAPLEVAQAIRTARRTLGFT